jgi:photosystem II oxygen-evolving enhancer protein 2
MLKSAVCALMVVLTFCLSGCVTPTSGLVPFVDSKDGYRFLYPNGWLETKLKNGPDILFHDIIEPSEMVSVVISKLESVKTLPEIGTPNDVGLRVRERVIAAAGSGREAQLLSAEQREVSGKPYYLLEYAVKRTNGESRHDLVSVSAARGNLYTLSISSLENRWTKVKSLFHRVASSFAVE